MEERKRINSNNKPCRECKPVTYVPRFFDLEDKQWYEKESDITENDKK